MILSGTATHGTLGLDAIKADGRITFAQDESARDDSMPCVALRGSHFLAGEHCERSTSQVASKKSLRRAPPRVRFQMSRATPKMRVFAKRLIAYETRENRSSETKTPVAFLVGEKLRPHLARLMGKVGFRELLSRALVLAKAEVPWLNAVRIKADGSFEELDELAAQVDPDEISEGRVILLAQLLGLLVTFVGEELTLRLVREVWPKLSLSNLDFGKGDKNEKPK